MNSADLATCRRFSDALAREDLAAAAAEAHADIELRLACETRRGAAALGTLVMPAGDVERTIVIADVLDAVDRAIALARFELRRPDTNELVGVEHVGAVLEVIDGRVASWQPFHHNTSPDRKVGPPCTACSTPHMPRHFKPRRSLAPRNPGRSAARDRGDGSRGA